MHFLLHLSPGAGIKPIQRPWDGHTRYTQESGDKPLLYGIDSSAMAAGSAPDADCGLLHSLLLLANSKQQFPEMGSWIRRGRSLFSCGLTLQGQNS